MIHMFSYKNIILLVLLTVAFQYAKSQDKQPVNNPFTVKGTNKSVIVQYKLSQNKSEEKVNVLLYRGNQVNENVKAIQQLNNLSLAADYYFIDSTLPGQGTYQYTIEIVSNNIVVVRETATAYVYEAGLTPFLKAFNAKAKSQSNEVTITWNIANSFIASNFTLLRSRNFNDGFAPIATFKNSDKTYLDKVNDANEPFFYRLQIANIITGAIIYSPTIQVLADFVIKPKAVQNLLGLIKNERPYLSWESNDPLSRGFYVFKKGFADKVFLQASGIITKGNASRFSWVDSSQSLLPGQSYQYMIKAESNSYNSSLPSDTVWISIDEIEQPIAAPQNIRIINNPDNTITIAWNEVANASNITGFTVYQKSKTNRSYVAVKNGSVSIPTNYVTIPNPENGSSYIVKSRVDSLEGAASEPVEWINANEKSFGPRYLKGEVIESALNISWLNSANDNIKEYRLYKWTGRDYAAVQTIDKNTNSVVVKNYIAGEKNQYILTAINLKGAESEGTKAITVY
jgi:hypothetical protein